MNRYVLQSAKNPTHPAIKEEGFGLLGVWAVKHAGAGWVLCKLMGRGSGEGLHGILGVDQGS